LAPQEEKEEEKPPWKRRKKRSLCVACSSYKGMSTDDPVLTFSDEQELF